MQVVVEDVIRAPRDRVFALSTDLDRAGEWMPKEVVVERLSPTSYRETRPVLGRLDSRVYEISVLDAPRRAEVVSGGFRFRMDYEAVDASTTRVTMTGTGDLGCLGVVVAPIARRVMRKNMAVDLAGLKAWIESQNR